MFSLWKPFVANIFSHMSIFNIIKNPQAKKASDFSAQDLELVSRVRFPIGNDELEVRHCSASEKKSNFLYLPTRQLFSPLSTLQLVHVLLTVYTHFFCSTAEKRKKYNFKVTQDGPTEI